jgi:hypothetical protein
MIYFIQQGDDDPIKIFMTKIPFEGECAMQIIPLGYESNKVRVNQDENGDPRWVTKSKNGTPG